MSYVVKYKVAIGGSEEREAGPYASHGEAWEHYNDIIGYEGVHSVHVEEVHEASPMPRNESQTPETLLADDAAKGSLRSSGSAEAKQAKADYLARLDGARIEREQTVTWLRSLTSAWSPDDVAGAISDGDHWGEAEPFAKTHHWECCCGAKTTDGLDALDHKDTCVLRATPDRSDADG